MKDCFNVEFSEGRSELIKAPKELNGAYVIPEGVTIICTSAFDGCASLNKLTIPRSLKTVEKNAFSGCKALTSLFYDGDMLSWLGISWKSWIECGHRLFFKNGVDYQQITCAEIPESVVELPALCFYYCKDLKRVIFHDGITSIGASAFNKSDLSGEIELPNSLEKLGNYVFLSCKHLNSIFIPDSVKAIGNGCFAYCDNLSKIIVDDENSMFTGNPQRNAIFDKFQTKLIACAPVGEGFLLLSKTCQSIADLTFGGCKLSRVFLRNVSTPVTGFQSCKSLFFVPAGTKPHYIKMGFPEGQITEECDPEKLSKKKEFSIIDENPYRTLGAYANDSARTISANATRIKRYSDVGKAITFPIDGVLSTEVKRSVDSVEDALASINLPLDKVKNALFWLGKPEDDNDALLQHILKQEWKEISSEYTNDSSKYPNGLNRALAKYFKGNKPFFITSFLRCVHSDAFRDGFLREIVDDASIISKEDFQQTAINCLLEECDSKQLYALLRAYDEFSDDALYVKNRIVGEFTSAIYTEIQRAKKVDEDKSESNLSVARALIDKTREPLARISEFLGESDTQYVVIADALAKQILQSGINYFNSSSDKGAAFNAFEIQSYATDIAKGKLVKERCEENLSILKKILSSLPPKGLLELDERIREFIESYEDDYMISRSMFMYGVDNAINGFASLIGEIDCYRKTVTTEKERQNVDLYQAHLSTRFIESVLAPLIDSVNERMKMKSIFDDDMYGYGGLSGMGHLINSKEMFLGSAKDIMSLLASLPMEEEYRKKRFEPNMNTLCKMYVSYGGYVTSSEKKADRRTEDELFSECSRSVKNCHYYLERHPKGKYREEVYSLIDEFDWLDCNSIDKYKYYAQIHKNGKHIAEAQAKIDSYNQMDKAAWENCSDIKSLEKYIADYPKGAFVTQAKEEIKKKEERLTTFKVIGGIVIGAIVILLISL